MVEKSVLNHRSTMPSLGNLLKASDIWKNITKPFHGNSDYSHTLTNNMDLSIGCGNQIHLWDDDWAGDFNLQNAFLRIYVLALKKSSYVNDFGS